MAIRPREITGVQKKPKAPPVGYDPKILTAKIETVQDAREYVRAAEHQSSVLERQKAEAQAKVVAIIEEEKSNISTIVRTEEGGPGVYLYKDPEKGKYSAESFRNFQQDTNKFVENVDASVENLQENIVTVNQAIESIKSAELRAMKPTPTTRQFWTVTDPRTGVAAKFIEEADAQRYLDNLNTELIMGKRARVGSEARQEWERKGEIASQSPVHVALADLVSRGIVTHTPGVEGHIVYQLVDSVYHLSQPDLELAKTAGFDITIGERQPAPWTESNERQLKTLFSNSIGLSGGTSIGKFQTVGKGLAKSSGGVIFNPVGENPTLEWVGQQLIEGGIKSIPLWVGGRLAMAVVGSAGMIVIPLWQYLAGIAAGAPLVPQVDFVVPKDVYARNQQMKTLLQEHPETFLEVTLEGVGGLLTMGGLEVGLSKIQQARINKLYSGLQPEDFYVDEEILMQYPEDASYQQIVHEQIYRPVSTHLVSQDLVNPATLIEAGYKKGAFYKIGDEYGIVMVGEGAIPVKITPGMDTTPMTVFKPIDITNIIDIIQHNPGIILDLNRLTAQGIKLPAWLAGAGVRVSVLSQSDLKNMSVTGNEVILDQEGNVYYRQTEIMDVWTEQTIQQRQDLNVEEVLEEVLEETSKFQSIEIPTMEVIEDIIPGLELRVEEITEPKAEVEEIPLVISDLELAIPPVPTIEIQIPEIDEIQLPADPIERQVELLRHKMIREGTPGVGKATRALRTKLLKQKRRKEEARKIPPSKKLESYHVLFTYQTGASETEWVDARTFHHALNIAQRRRKIKLVPIDVLIEYRARGAKGAS